MLLSEGRGINPRPELKIFSKKKLNFFVGGAGRDALDLRRGFCVATYDSYLTKKSGM